MAPTRTFLIASLLMLVAAAAEAQPRPDRGFILINGGVQAAAADLHDSFEFEEHVETGSMTIDYPGRMAGLFDGGAGVHVWRRVGLGVAFSRAAASGSGRVSARVPHPLFDDRHRTVDGEATNVSRTETALHVQVYYDVPTAGLLRVRLFGGPSFFNASQDLVHRIEVTERFPFDTAEFARAETRRAEASATGLHAGADLSWMFGRRIGAGALVRYTRASLDFPAGAARSVASDVGGVQAAAGLRIAF